MAVKYMVIGKLIIEYITIRLNNFDSTQQSFTWDGWVQIITLPWEFAIINARRQQTGDHWID